MNIETYKEIFVLNDYKNTEWGYRLRNENRVDVIKDYMETRVELINKPTESIFEKYN